jgi:acetylglutamate/LysW-gamma-L-alpha-aminoadipate kinase
MDLALGRMKHKMMGAAAALEQGVGTVILGDARHEYPIQQALQGQGTVIQ